MLFLILTLGYLEQMFLKCFVCVLLSACRKSQVIFFFLLIWTAMNKKCFLQKVFSLLSAAHNFLFTICSANFALLRFYIFLVCFVVQWPCHQFQKFLFPQEVISHSCSPNLASCIFDPCGCWICLSWSLDVFADGTLYQLEQTFSSFFLWLNKGEVSYCS